MPENSPSNSNFYFRVFVSAFTVGAIYFADAFSKMIGEGKAPDKWELISSGIVMLSLMLKDISSRITPS